MMEIYRIELALPLRMGFVNCYLLKTPKGFILIDTGSANQRKALQEKLVNEGCKPGNLPLIILTHGDFDHIGNAAYLQRVFGSKIAISEYDSGMIEKGDMFWNRKSGNIILKNLIPLFFGFNKTNRMKPDIFIDDKYDLTKYGLHAKIIYLAGHSKGSQGILFENGDLVCGDLFENINGPKINSIMDDIEIAKTSIEKLRKMKINMVYPGHGNPFPFSMYNRNQK